ncbi:MAG: acyltransferase family protein [Chthoniobacterales bacterium]
MKTPPALASITPAETVARPADSIDPRFEHRNRRPGLDLLRALAIIVVVVYHTGIFGFALPYDLHRFGWVGVDLFFVLSGYLIGGQLLNQLRTRRRIRFARFYARRALRILPAYLVVLAVYFSLPALREFPSISPLWTFLISAQNIGLRGGTAFSHAWSLAIEDQFYLLLPLVLLALCRSRLAAVVVPCFVVVAGLLLRGYLAHQLPGDTGGVSHRGYQLWIYYPTWTRLDPLVLGVALAAVEQFRGSWWRALTGSARWLWVPAIGAIAYALYLGDGDILTVQTCVWQLPLIALGMAALLVCSLSPRLPFSRVEVPGMAFLASIAYSVYLSHKLIIHATIQLCSRYSISTTSVLALLLIEVAIYVIGAILFLAVERPFLQLRNRLAA